jgi:hypothetical protein
MKQDDIMYGLEGAETLDTEIDEVLERLLDDMCDKTGESFDAIANRIEWPVIVHEYKRMDASHGVHRIAERALEDAMERLDEEYGDPEGESTEPTDKMRSAAQAFAEAIIAEYVPWTCETNGKTHTITREQAREIVEPEESDHA